MGSASNSAGHVTRTHTTVGVYRRRVDGIIRKACSEGYVIDPGNVDPIELSRWLIEHKGSYCAATYRQYRAALMLWIAESTHPNVADATALLNTVDHVNNLKRGLSYRTSSTKDKKLSDTDRKAIIDWLSNHRSRYSVALSIFMQIGVSVGLRPSEWRTARVIYHDGHPTLQVINAKNTNGRANGLVRTLILDELPSELVDVIEKFCMIIRRLDKLGKWNNVYNGCRKTLYLACRTLWPNRKKFPTLYSLRHQFCADSKSAGMSRTEIAALMGHASCDTASTHYGKRRVGRGKCAVKPSAVDVERLRSRSDAPLVATFPGKQP